MQTALRYFYFLVILCSCSCISQDDVNIFSDNELDRLLASDSAKSWVLNDRFLDGLSIIEDCEQDDLLTFINTGIFQDTAEVIFGTGPVLCPNQSDTILFQGYWNTADSSNIQMILFVIDSDTSFRTMDFISSQWLTITYIDDAAQITEEYTSAD